MCKRICELTSRGFFLLGARLTFGIWLLYIGVFKWLTGSAGFLGHLTSNFAETWVPTQLLVGTGWFILVAEPLCGLWLIAGIKQRSAWSLTTLLMFILMFGQTVLGTHATVANNWQYLILALACAALSDKGSQEHQS